MTTRLVYTVAEAAEMLHISRRSCQELVTRGEIRCVRLGRNVRIPTSALEELLGQPIVESVPCSVSTGGVAPVAPSVGAEEATRLPTRTGGKR